MDFLLSCPDYEIPLVVTHQPYSDESVWFESVADRAKQSKVPIIVCGRDNEEKLLRIFSEIQPDIIISVNYRRKISMNAVSMARIGAFNIHDSLLPHYRGFAPSVWALLRGEAETGVTLHEIVEEVDMGPIVAQRALPILPDDTIRELLARIRTTTLDLIRTSLPLLASEQFERIPQTPGTGFFMPRRSVKDDYIDWTGTADSIRNFVRAVAPPIAFARTRLGQHELRIDDAIVEQGSHGQEFALPPGTVLDCLSSSTARVQTIDGTIIICFSPVPGGAEKREHIVLMDVLKPGECLQ
ncbi:hypothetical protein [Azospirillum argentinense]